MPYDDDQLSKEVQAQLGSSDVAQSPVTPEPVQQTQVGAALPRGIIVPPRRRSKLRYFIIAIISLVVAGGAGYFAYTQFLAPKPEQSVTPPPAPSQEPNAEMTAVSIIDKLKKGFSISDTKNDRSVSYNVPDTNVWLAPSESDGVIGFDLIVNELTTYERDLKKIKDRLKAAGLKVILESESTDDSVYYIGHYGTDKIACSVWNDAEGDLLTDAYRYTKFITSVSCTDIANMDNIVNKYKPFVQVVSQGLPDKYGTQLSGLQIADAKISGYQTAKASVSGPTARAGGGVGLFYKAPNQDWKLFKIVQSVLSCSDYNTDDLKNAYAGVTCYEEDVESVVRSAAKAA